MEELSDTVETKEPKKTPKEVPVVQDQGFFQHQTGDTYEGFFEAKKKDRSVKMNGPGVYRTAEGDTYSGVWEGDKLGNEEVCIAYKEGATFSGYIKDWCYSGRGKYTYPDASVLTSDFTQNCPVGQLVLTDPNRHTWLGTADQGYGWFEPVNHYYQLLETRDFVGPKTRSKKKADHEKDLKESSKKEIIQSPTKTSPSKTNDKK